MFPRSFSLMARACFIAAVATIPALAQPAIQSILNSANYQAGVAQGSIFVVFGSNMGPASISQVSSLPLTPSLSGTSITFTPVGGGTAVQALMVYTLAGQVSALLPSSAPVGDHNVTVTYNGQTSQPFRTQVVARNLGLYTMASSGTGPLVAQNFISATQVVTNEFTAPARPGQPIVLYGTGLGPIPVSDANPPGAQDLRSAANVRVIIAGVEVNPDYAGRNPSIPGLDQINFTLPADIGLGCVVPLQVRVGNVTTSKLVSLAIAGPQAETCAYPGLDATALRRLAGRETLLIGEFSLDSSSVSAAVPLIGEFQTGSESAGGAFARVNLANVTEYAGLSGLSGSLQFGSCMVGRLRTNGAGLDFQAEIPPNLLDAGASLTLNGPNVSNRSVPRQADKSYDLTLRTLGNPLQPAQPAVIAAGEYTLTGTGGADVGAFSARIRVPSPLNWTNRTSIPEIVRSQPLTLTWNGGGDGDRVTILGGSGRRVGGANSDVYDTTFFFCTQRASAGSFTVPTAILQQLPPVTNDVLSQESIGLLGLIATPADGAGRFAAPLTAGGNVDYAQFIYELSYLRLLDVK